jgi:hypothetical protein
MEEAGEIQRDGGGEINSNRTSRRERFKQMEEAG